MQSKYSLTVLTIIHGALVIGLLIFCAVAYWQNPSFKAAINPNDIFVYIVPFFAAVGYFASKFIFQNRIKKIDKEDTLQSKFSKHQIASIIQYALIEAPAFFALIAYFLNQNALHLVVGLCLIAYLFSRRPTLNRFQNTVPLTPEEKRLVNS